MTTNYEEMLTAIVAKLKEKTAQGESLEGFTVDETGNLSKLPYINVVLTPSGSPIVNPATIPFTIRLIVSVESGSNVATTIAEAMEASNSAKIALNGFYSKMNLFTQGHEINPQNGMPYKGRVTMLVELETIVQVQ